jgi:hypothetical protein
MDRNGRGIMTKTNRYYFIVLVFLGFVLRSGALVLTNVGITSGQFTELNPMYYSIGGMGSFVVLGFAIIVVIYGVLWFAKIPSLMSIVIAFVITIVTAFDFFHDLFTLSLNAFETITHLAI